MTKPRISVIVPTYNRADRILPCIRSVLLQDFMAWELIVVDDGSTDHTREVVERIQTDNPDCTIRYVHQSNGGPAKARNTGVECTTSENIVYLDSDDQLFPSALGDIFYTLENGGGSYGLTNHNRTLRLVDGQGQELVRKFDVSGVNKNVTLEQIYNWEIKTTSTGLFHKKHYFDEGARWKSGFWIEDLEFMLQLAAFDPDGFVHIPKVLVDYVQTYGADGLCSNASYNDWANAFERIYDLHKDDPLMKNPDVYLGRVEKYKKLHQDAMAGNAPPQHYKYFPEYFELTKKSA